MDLPANKPEKANIVGAARKIIFAAGDPGRQIEIASEQGIAINDARQWNSPTYQVSVPLESAGDTADASFTLRFPEGTAAQLKPRLAMSSLGYSMGGLKEITMEWPKGLPRPADDVRIENASGERVAEGRFGPTISLAYMQNEFATFTFPKVTSPGTYRAVWAAGESRDFQIKPTIFDDTVWAPTLDVFIPWQMCHAQVTFADGSMPDLPACHMDDAQRVPANFPGIDGFRSYEADLTPYKPGDMIPCAIGGWHDAGDYDVNVHATAHSTWKMALAFEEFGIAHDRTTIDIPAQRVIAGKPDGVPDILQQVQWGAQFLLTMQQKDGLVYTGVCGRPGGQYTAAVLPEKLSDQKPGTGDERYLYVDYQPGAQLAQVISLAAVGRVVREVDAPLARRCVDAAEQAYAYFQKAPDISRPNAYFEKKPEDGRTSATAAALAELYLSTGKAEYLKQLSDIAPQLEKEKVSWPAAYATGTGGWWYAPTVLARLAGKIDDGDLKTAVVQFCKRAAAEQASQSSPRPWPFQWWHVLDWGAGGHALNRVFDAYYLEKAVPNTFKLADTQREMLWMYGYHPLSDTAFVAIKGVPSPKFLYNGRLHGRYGEAAASVPGAVVPGMGGVPGAGMVSYADQHGNYYHNEACIYSAADYLFAVHALKSAGY